jgi:hypothetical protein
VRHRQSKESKPSAKARGGRRVRAGRLPDLAALREAARAHSLAALYEFAAEEIATWLAVTDDRLAAAIMREARYRSVRLDGLLKRKAFAALPRPLPDLARRAWAIVGKRLRGLERAPDSTATRGAWPPASLEGWMAMELADTRPACRASWERCSVCGAGCCPAMPRAPRRCLFSEKRDHSLVAVGTIPHRHCERCGIAAAVCGDSDTQTNPGHVFLEHHVTADGDTAAAAAAAWVCIVCERSG